MKDPQTIKVMTKVGFPENHVWLLAAAEIAGAAGVVGLFWWPIAVAAATGVTSYFVGAIAAQLRVKDRNVASASVLLVAAGAVLVLRA